MKRRHALLLAALITGLVASNLAILEITNQENKHIITIAEVIDGDTLKTTEGETLRLANINTPEKNKPGYDQAKNFLEKYENQTVTIEDLGADKYQRTLARIYTLEGEYLNLRIIQEGLAVKFLVEPEETKLFSQAETLAVAQQKGIWTHSQHYNCIQADIDEKAEVIILTNACASINLNNWFLKDESRKTYTFHDTTITNALVLHTTKGQDTTTEKYWNLKTNVWNNDRDTLYLFDDQDNIVTTQSYGYGN